MSDHIQRQIAAEKARWASNIPDVDLFDREQDKFPSHYPLAGDVARHAVVPTQNLTGIDAGSLTRQTLNWHKNISHENKQAWTNRPTQFHEKFNIAVANGHVRAAAHATEETNEELGGGYAVALTPVYFK